MKFGVQHGVGDPAWTPPILDPENVKRFVRLAEDSGYDGITFTDHPAPSAQWVEAGGEGVADAMSSLSFCAAVTSTIRLLTWVMVPPFRNPFTTAHQVATLDHLSRGRVTLGLGTGYLRSEFHAVGVDPKQKLAIFEENVAVMKQVWAGQDVRQESSRFSARAVRSVPSAFQKPHPPLFIHGNSAWGVDYAAKHADGWIGMITTEQQVKTIRTRAIPDMQTLARRIEDLAAACESNGRDIGDMDIAACGMWPMLDIRRDFDAGAMRADVERLHTMGATWAVFNVCGDDPIASQDTIAKFADEVIAASR